MQKRNSREGYADPQLTLFANSLRHIVFDGLEHNLDAFAALEDAHKLCNVALFPDQQTYRVRMYLGGKQRVIGITTNGPAAARFADMARIYFWPYRLRGSKEPQDCDTNFGLESAHADIANNPKALILLKAILTHLQLFGEMKTGAQPVKESRRTVRHEMATFLREQSAEVAESYNTLIAEMKSHRELTEAQREQQALAFQQLIERIESLEKQQLNTLTDTLTAIRRLGEPQTSFSPLASPPAPFLVSPACPDWTYIPDNPMTPGPATPPPVWCQDKSMPPTS